MQSALELAPQLPLEPAAESTTEAQRLQRLAEELLAGRLYLRDEGQRRTAGRLHRQLIEALEAKRPPGLLPQRDRPVSRKLRRA